MRIAFVQLGSWGDNVNSTLMLKPIKDAYKDATIEVHTADIYASAFRHNPYIDKITEYPAVNKTVCFNLYNTIPSKVQAQQYDKVFVPAPILHPTRRNSLLHPEFGENIITTFMRVLEDNNIEYEWPVKTILQLQDNEINNVNKFLSDKQLAGKRNILMETHGESGQTFWNNDWTLAVGRHLMKKPTNLFISRQCRTSDILQLEREYNSVYWVGNLTIRECAELYNRCDVFFSVSSGLSNACNTNHCATNKQWIETVNSYTVTSAPLRTNNKIFWYDQNLTKFVAMLNNIGV